MPAATQLRFVCQCGSCGHRLLPSQRNCPECGTAACGECWVEGGFAPERITPTIRLLRLAVLAVLTLLGGIGCIFLLGPMVVRPESSAACFLFLLVPFGVALGCLLLADWFGRAASGVPARRELWRLGHDGITIDGERRPWDTLREATLVEEESDVHSVVIAYRSMWGENRSVSLPMPASDDRCGSLADTIRVRAAAFRQEAATDPRLQPPTAESRDAVDDAPTERRVYSNSQWCSYCFGVVPLALDAPCPTCGADSRCQMISVTSEIPIPFWRSSWRAIVAVLLGTGLLVAVWTFLAWIDLFRAAVPFLGWSVVCLLGAAGILLVRDRTRDSFRVVDSQRVDWRANRGGLACGTARVAWQDVERLEACRDGDRGIIVASLRAPASRPCLRLALPADEEVAHALSRVLSQLARPPIEVPLPSGTEMPRLLQLVCADCGYPHASLRPECAECGSRGLMATLDAAPPPFPGQAAKAFHAAFRPLALSLAGGLFLLVGFAVADASPPCGLGVLLLAGASLVAIVRSIGDDGLRTGDTGGRRKQGRDVTLLPVRNGARLPLSKVGRVWCEESAGRATLCFETADGWLSAIPTTLTAAEAAPIAAVLRSIVEGRRPLPEPSPTEAA